MKVDFISNGFNKHKINNAILYFSDYIKANDKSINLSEIINGIEIY